MVRQSKIEKRKRLNRLLPEVRRREKADRKRKLRGKEKESKRNK